MIIIWGYQGTEKKLGYVAEYCGNCQDVRSVKIIRVGRVFHLYYIPFGEGALVGYDGVCRRCELRFGVTITDYPEIEKDKHAELVTLVEKTNPKLVAGNEAAMAAWRRMSEVREPFVRYNRNLVQRSLSAAGFDARTIIAFLASVAVPLAFFYLASMVAASDAANSTIVLISVALFLGGFTCAVVLSRKAPLRYFSSNVEKPLIEEVRRLAPSRAELEGCVAGLREYGYRIANLVSVERILESPAERPRETVSPAPAMPVAPAPAPAPAPVPVPTAHRQAREPMATLVLSHGGKEYRFAPGVAEISIGRSLESAIVIPSKFVSRSHATIAWPAGSAPGLKNLSSAGTSLRIGGTPHAVPSKGEILLNGNGSIALGADFAAAEAEGDVLHFKVIEPVTLA